MDIDKRRKAAVLQIAIQKVRNAVIEDNAWEYLKRFKGQPWYDAAVLGYVEITDQFGGLLQDWQRDTLKIIGRDNLFTNAVQKAGKYRTEEYLDSRYNRVVVDDIKDELLELQQAYRKKLETLFQSVIAGKLATGIASALKTDHMPFNFNEYNTLVRDMLRDKKIHWAKQVAETTEQQVKSALVDGYEKGLSSFDIASNIKARATFSIFRAEKVARTESMASCNLADYARFQANDDVAGYRWKSAGGRRSRDTHKAASGQFRVKGKPFIVGGYKMQHPGDGSLGAPAKEIINCRCWLEPVFADEIGGLSQAERKMLSAPQYVGTIDTSKPDLIKFKLKEFEDFAVGKTVEYAYTILPSGKCYRFIGGSGSVHPEVLGAALQGAIISHNHPKSETEYSLSQDDLGLMIAFGIKQINGFDYKYRYSTVNKGCGLELFRAKYTEAYAKARENTPILEAEEDFIHNVNLQMVEFGLITYRREKR